MKNEIVKHEANQWLKLKFKTAGEIAVAKSKGLILKTGIRKISMDNETFVFNELQEMIKRVADLCGADNLKKNVVVEELITLFQEDNAIYHLTLSDVYLAFKRGASGKYHDTYGKITFQDLRKWLYAYEDERIGLIETEYKTEKENTLTEKTSKSVRQMVYGIDKNLEK